MIRHLGLENFATAFPLTTSLNREWLSVTPVSHRNTKVEKFSKCPEIFTRNTKEACISSDFYFFTAAQASFEEEGTPTRFQPISHFRPVFKKLLVGPFASENVAASFSKSRRLWRTVWLACIPRDGSCASNCGKAALPASCLTLSPESAVLERENSACESVRGLEKLSQNLSGMLRADQRCMAS